MSLDAATHSDPAGPASPHFTDLPLSVAKILNDHLAEPLTDRLPDFLSKLADCIRDPSRLTALAIVTWDVENPCVPEPLAIGTSHQGDPTELQLYLSYLTENDSASESNRHSSGRGKAEDQESNPSVLALKHQDKTIGSVLIWWEQREDTQNLSLIRNLEQHAPILTAALQAAIRAESWARLRQVDEIVRDFFDRSQPKRNRWDLLWLVQEVGRVYDAQGVTIFIEEDERLLPAASIDPEFERRANPSSSWDGAEHGGERQPVFYRRGQGLTGWVYEQGRSLRIRDEEETIRRQISLDRTGPSFVDHDEQGAIVGQFLGAPLRFGKEVVGVIRLSRRSHLDRFTNAEESTLQYLADLLGSALGNWRRVHFADAILESITEGIAVSRRLPDSRGGASDRIVFANPGIAKILGCDREEVQAMDAPNAYAAGEYEKLLPELRAVKKQARDEGRGEHEPIRTALQRKNGSTVPVNISFRIQPNRLVRPPTYSTIAIARDLTKQEESAEQHRRLLEFLDALNVAYFRADMGAWTLESTDADSLITGYSNEDWTRYRRTVLYEKPDSRDEVLALLRQSGGKLARYLVELRRKNGDAFWAEVDIRLIRDQTGREIEVEGCYRDVSAQMKLQRFLNENEDRLLPQNELLARLQEEAELQIDYIASIGHQIQAPLGSLLGTLDSMERGALTNAQLREQLPTVLGQLRASSRLVRNLSYMDMVLRRDPIRFEQVRLRRLINESRQDVATALEAKQLRLEIQERGLRQHLEVVFGHPELLRQVVVNLIDNAIKYSLPHTTIHIRGKRWRAGRGLEITNRGLRISPADRRRIFKRGFRSPQARAVVPHGTGLGLWLVREILSLHRATIYCTEISDNGRERTAFRMVFPRDTTNPIPRSPK